MQKTTILTYILYIIYLLGEIVVKNHQKYTQNYYV